MRSVQPGRLPIAVDASDLGGLEDQLRLRLSQVVGAHVDSHLLAALDNYVAIRVSELVERRCHQITVQERLLDIGTDREPHVVRYQRALFERFDRKALDHAIEATVARRVAELFDVATSSVSVPSHPIDLSGVPVMTEDEALRAADAHSQDPRLSGLAGGVDPEEV